MRIVRTQLENPKGIRKHSVALSFHQETIKAMDEALKELKKCLHKVVEWRIGEVQRKQNVQELNATLANMPIPIKTEFMKNKRLAILRVARLGNNDSTSSIAGVSTDLPDNPDEPTKIFINSTEIGNVINLKSRIIPVSNIVFQLKDLMPAESLRDILYASVSIYMHTLRTSIIHEMDHIARMHLQKERKLSPSGLLSRKTNEEISEQHIKQYLNSPYEYNAELSSFIFQLGNYLMRMSPKQFDEFMTNRKPIFEILDRMTNNSLDNRILYPSMDDTSIDKKTVEFRRRTTLQEAARKINEINQIRKSQEGTPSG